MMKILVKLAGRHGNEDMASRSILKEMWGKVALG